MSDLTPDLVIVLSFARWTSALQLRGREFCFILNRAVRGDEPPLADPTAGLSRGINKLCVSVPPKPPFPPGDVCLRGGGFDDRFRSFFIEGRKFRQPAYLATSFSEDVARNFLAMRGGSDCVLWRVRFVSFSSATTKSLEP